jgi:hypothetical protein
MSAPFRIGKHPAFSGLGNDCHQAMPPSQPPVPPAPVNPAPMPSNYVMVAIVMIPSQYVFGKWSTARVSTEGMPDILSGHDWGMGQIHTFISPVVLVTPSMAFCTLGSSHKFWLPCSAVEEAVSGGVINGCTGGKGAVAPVTPAYLMSVQDCMDVAGNGFNVPTGVTFVAPTLRWVGVTCGDLVAGLVGMAGDSLVSFGAGKLGGAIAGEMGAAANSLTEAAIGTAVSAYIGVVGTIGQNAIGSGSAGGMAGVGGQAVAVPVVGAGAAVAGGIGAGAGALGSALQGAIDGPDRGTERDPAFWDPGSGQPNPWGG